MTEPVVKAELVRVDDAQVPPKAPGANCHLCPLRDIGAFVPSVGPAKARIAFVGEAPGFQEANKGIPFIGPSGRLLDTVMQAHGIKREEVFLSNACLCRPPDNATPPKSAIAACRPRLLGELKDREVETVVALGNSAASSTLGMEGVFKLRVGPGRTSPYKELEGARVIPSIHPAACLRQGDFFPYLIRDVGKIHMSVSPWEEPWYQVVDDEETALVAIGRLLGDGTVTELDVDIEVDIDKDNSFDHPDRYGLLCIGIAFADNRVLVIGEEALKSQNVLDWLKKLFNQKLLSGQNLKFDNGGLYRHVGPLTTYFDTMIASYCMDERPGIHGLEQQAVELLGAPDWKGVLKKYVGPKDGYGVVPRDVLYKYNAFDVACTRALRKVRLERLDQPPPYWPYPTLEPRTLKDLHDFLVEASNELMYPELNGLAIDKTYLDQLTHEYLEILEGIEKELDGHLSEATGGAFTYINPRSPKQVTEALAGMKIYVRSTREEILLKIKDRLEPGSPRHLFVSTLLRHRREQKLYGTYVKGMRKRMFRGRVFPTFLLHGTTSGRLACRNPNLQNIPRESKIRRLFVPGRTENVFVHTDYSQAELRVLTWLAQEPYFRNIFNDPDRDLFDELVPILYGNVTGLSDSQKKELRIRIKAYVYGLAYGRTEFSIADEFKIPVVEAKRGMNKFFEVIPEIVRFNQTIQKRVLSGQDLITPFGRHRRFHLITKDNRDDTLREAQSFTPQSTASDLTLRAFTRIRRETRGTGCYIRNIIHDAILAEAPKEKAEWLGEMMNQHMIDSAKELVGDYVLFKTETKIGTDWGSV